MEKKLNNINLSKTTQKNDEVEKLHTVLILTPIEK